MNLPKTSEELKTELFCSVDLMQKIGDLRIRQLIRILNKIPEQIIVDGVIKIFQNTDRPISLYLDQKNAGRILKELNPKTDLDILEILNKVVKNWDKSVPEFPFWLRKNYGIELLTNAITEFEKENRTTEELDNLKTIKWWLGIKI